LNSEGLESGGFNDKLAEEIYEGRNDEQALQTAGSGASS
jgi:hypothetical protein